MLISAIEHYSYCPRQFGLIHLEQTFDENLFTLRGHQAHSRVDEETQRWEQDRVIERSLPLWSHRYGLMGRADVVEFAGMDPGPRRPYPIEYKSGRPVQPIHAALQLCAQALCLEEMLQEEVREGALYFARTKRRVGVRFDADLRMCTLKVVEEIRLHMDHSRLPPPVNDKRCPNCSLVDACLPGAISMGAEPTCFRPSEARDLP